MNEFKIPNVSDVLERRSVDNAGYEGLKKIKLKLEELAKDGKVTSRVFEGDREYSVTVTSSKTDFNDCGGIMTTKTDQVVYSVNKATGEVKVKPLYTKPIVNPRYIIN